MPIIDHLTKTPGEQAEEANLKSNTELNIDKDEYPIRVVNLIRDQDAISLSKELSILRKTLKIICDKLEIKNEDFENYNTLVEEAKIEAKENFESANNEKDN